MLEDILAELDNVGKICAEIRAEEFARFMENADALAIMANVFEDEGE